MIAIKLALIAPYAHANVIQHTDYQLLLPQCLHNPRYEAAYRKARRNGSYLILDNGIAEGIETSPTILTEVADRYMVNEVVVPDTLGDAVETLKQAFTFMNWSSDAFNYMGVVQGSTFGECFDCIYGFSSMAYITTLGIPRHLLTKLGEDARIRIVAHIRKQYDDRFYLHLLGTNPDSMDELTGYGRLYRMYGVRGIDTSAPFNYSLAGVSLAAAKHIAVSRPQNYFDLHIDDSELNYANLCIIKDWVYSSV